MQPQAFCCNPQRNGEQENADLPPASLQIAEIAEKKREDDRHGIRR
jgi:hypothetical protein